MEKRRPIEQNSEEEEKIKGGGKGPRNGRLPKLSPRKREGFKWRGKHKKRSNNNKRGGKEKRCCGQLNEHGGRAMGITKGGKKKVLFKFPRTRKTFRGSREGGGEVASFCFLGEKRSKEKKVGRTQFSLTSPFAGGKKEKVSAWPGRKSSGDSENTAWRGKVGGGN